MTLNNGLTWDDTSEEDTVVTQVGNTSIQVIDSTKRPADRFSIFSDLLRIIVSDSVGKTIDDFEIDLGKYNLPEEVISAAKELRKAIQSSLNRTTSRKLDSLLKEIGA